MPVRPGGRVVRCQLRVACVSAGFAQTSRSVFDIAIARRCQQLCVAEAGSTDAKAVPADSKHEYASAVAAVRPFLNSPRA